MTKDKVAELIESIKEPLSPEDFLVALATKAEEAERNGNTMPAFPRDHAHDGHNGMTLRDYFAAKAMQELVGVFTAKEGAEKAYEWADAMLKAREK